MSNRIFGDFVKVHLGRIDSSWNPGINGGVVYADDVTTLGENAKALHFFIIHPRNDDGKRTGEAIFVYNGITNRYHEFVYEGIDAIIGNLSFLKPWEKEIFRYILNKSSDYEPSYSDVLCEDRPEPGHVLNLCYEGRLSLGEGGEISITEDDKKIAPNSLVINILPFNDCIGTINVEVKLGVDISDCEPDDNYEMCAVIWAPNEDEIVEQIKEADKQRIRYNGSVLEHLGILERWKTIEIDLLKDLWDFVLNNLSFDTNIDHHISVARFAKYSLHDNETYRKIIEGAKLMVESGEIGYVDMAIIVSQELSYDINNNRDEVYELMNAAVNRASTANHEDLCKIIHAMANEYTGCQIGDKEFAKNTMENILSRVSNSKTKAAIKRKALKALDDCS